MPDGASNHITNSGQILDVLVIGAGFSGVCVAIKLLQRGMENFRVFEKSAGIGGTWYDNTYPGATCDVPSHLYCYSFEPNPDWSRVYSPQTEIQQYLEHCVDKYGVRPFIENETRILELKLDENAGLWEAVLQDGRHIQARVIVNGAGGLHEPSVPQFPGQESFTGPAMHTARWDHAVDLKDKNVAVIGSAASAIQVVPEIAKVARHVALFQRTPNYIAPRKDRAYTAAEKRQFSKWPRLAALYRWLIFMRLELFLFPITKKGSWLGARGGKLVTRYMRSLVDDPELQEKLEPDYAMGCKRILISDEFYATLNRENVETVTDGIERVEAHGIRSTDGHLHKADVIVYATGFDIEKHMRAIRTTGQGGRLLADVWRDGPEAYRGACVAGFPNYFMVTGPNTGVATTSVVYMVEQQVDYIVKLIDAAGDARLIGVTPSAQDAYNADLQASLQQRVWASGCDSWYRRPDGKITTLYPHNARTFRRQVRHPRLADFEFFACPESGTSPCSATSRRAGE